MCWGETIHRDLPIYELMIRSPCEVTFGHWICELYYRAIFIYKSSFLVINQSEGCIDDQSLGQVMWSHSAMKAQS